MSAAVFAGVDWGTTSFRLWLFDAGGSPLAQQKAPWGMRDLAPDQFAGKLEEALAAVAAPAGLPVIICGMAGAAEGWHQAPYADLPVQLARLAEYSVRIPGQERETRIISGLAQRSPRPDVMRGEETKLVGAFQKRRFAGHVCMPGTHAKWALIEEGEIVGFSTSLTGELFSLLNRHSTLAGYLDRGHGGYAQSSCFLDSVQEALAAPEAILQRLFLIRADGVLNARPAGELAERLSGWLIGMEIAGMRAKAGSAVALIADGDIAENYHGALQLADFECTVISAETSVQAGLFQAGRQLWLEG